MRGRLSRRAGAAVALGLALALGAAACGGNGGAGQTGGGSKTLRIGISAALSGSFAPFDVPLVNGMKYAVKEINAKGGLGGYKAELVVKDNKTDPNLTATTTQELLSSGIRVFVLTTADAAVASGVQVAKAGGISSIGAASIPSYTRSIGPSAFSVLFADNGQASADAQYACDSGYRKAYVLGANEFPYTRDIPKYFGQAFAKLCGGKVIGNDTYRLGQTEFGTQITKITNLSQKPDVIFSPIFVPDSGPFLKQLRAAGVTTPFLTTDGNDSPLFADAAGGAVAGTVFSTHGYAKPGSALSQFLRDYRRVTGKKPETTVTEAIGRDNVYVLLEGARRAKSLDPKKIEQAILGLRNYPLLTGTMSMNPTTRFAIKPVWMVKMNGTKPTLLKTITPRYIPPPIG